MRSNRPLWFSILMIPISVFVWTASLIWMGLTVVLCVALLPIFPFKRTHMFIARPLMSMCIRSTFSRMRIRYHPEFDKRQAGLFMGNHATVLDAHLMTWAIPGPFCGMVGVHHFKYPIYGWIIKLARSIPIYPRTEGQIAKLTDPVRERIAEGINIAAYPEGTRTRDGHVGPFKRGMFFMARDADIPVYPIAVRGLYEVIPSDQWIIVPGKIDVYVGRATSFTDVSDEDMPQAVEDFRRLVVDFVEHGRVPEGAEGLFPNLDAAAE